MFCWSRTGEWTANVRAMFYGQWIRRWFICKDDRYRHLDHKHRQGLFEGVEGLVLIDIEKDMEYCFWGPDGRHVTFKLQTDEASDHEKAMSNGRPCISPIPGLRVWTSRVLVQIKTCCISQSVSTSVLDSHHLFLSHLLSFLASVPNCLWLFAVTMGLELGLLYIHTNDDKFDKPPLSIRTNEVAEVVANNRLAMVMMSISMRFKAALAFKSEVASLPLCLGYLQSAKNCRLETYDKSCGELKKDTVAGYTQHLIRILTTCLPSRWCPRNM